MSKKFHDDSETTEITILPDGRVYIFGANKKIMTIMDVLQPSPEDISVQRANSVIITPDVAGVSCEQRQADQHSASSATGAPSGS